MSTRTSVFALCTLCLVAPVFACAGNAVTTFVAPSDHTVRSRLEPARNGRAQQVVVENSSTVEIVVNAVVLSQCENIRTRCETHPLRIPVGPGQRRPVFTIETTGGDAGHNFRYSFSWEASNAAPTIP